MTGWKIFEAYFDGETLHTSVRDAPELPEDSEPGDHFEYGWDEWEPTTIPATQNARQDIMIHIDTPKKARGKRLSDGSWVPEGEDDRVPMNNGRVRKRDDGSAFFIAFCETCDHEHEIALPCSPEEAKARLSAGMYSLGHPVLPCAEHKKAP